MRALYQGDAEPRGCGREGLVLYSMRMKLLVVVGTRPEAIKLDPLIRAAKHEQGWAVTVVCTGQHDVLLAPLLGRLGFEGTSLPASAAMPDELRNAIAYACPDVVVGQGDTTSALAAARAAQRCGVDFVHVEAGLRTGDLEHPCPEEAHRVEIASLAALHLAPTITARENLLREGIEDARVVVTGNTGSDAVARTLAGLPCDGRAPSARLAEFGPRWVLVTMHRREGLEGGLGAVCEAIEALAQRHRDTDFVWPLHANPKVHAIAACLRGQPNVRLMDPLRHDELLWVLRGSEFVITDSGGVQEEACAVRVPALIARRHTERIESVHRGWAKVVGWDPQRLRTWASTWLRDEQARLDATPTEDLFGDGHAAQRCIEALRRWQSSRSPSRSVRAE